MIASNTNVFDGAIPSANSAGAYALLRLGRLLQNDEFTQAGTKILQGESARLSQMPVAHAYGLLALEWLLLPVREIVVAGDDAEPMLAELRKHFLPRSVMIRNDGNPKLRELVPFVENQKALGGKPTAYVCENYTCNAPVTDIEKLKEALASS